MATKEKKEIRVEKVLQDMSHSLNHIEDIMADDRALLVKIVKQNNSIVDYLKQLEVDVIDDYDNVFQEPLSEEEEKKMQKFSDLKEVLDEFLSKRQDLLELEKELRKHKDKIMPGLVGES